MPSEKHVFTRASILVRPLNLPASPLAGNLVEAPGTAPGSASVITHAVYRHSRFPDTLDIAIAVLTLKDCHG